MGCNETIARSGQSADVQSDSVLSWCESHRRCSQCLQPCKELWESGRGLSEKSCEHHECVTSAEFLLSLRSQKQGDCPSPQRASGFAAACVESCNADKECSGSKKCCPNGCGHTCQTPTNLFKGVPLKPKKDMSFSEDHSGHLEVKWMSKFNVSIEPVLYVLQRRWNYGIHPSEDEASSWQTVLMTIEERAVLKDVRPHRWYQFRVSAVNSQGTRGFTTPSKHFFSSRDPFPPEAPQNLRTGNFTARPDGTVSVPLRWDTAPEGDLPVHHYRVSWSVRGAQRLGQSRRENARVTDGAATELELPGLQPNVVHQVQVQAIAYWGQKRLKSPRALLSFTPTSTASSTAPGQGHFTGEFSNELPLSHSSPSIVRLEAAAPHYHDNQLQVKVFWKSRHQEEEQKETPSYSLRWYPEVCTNNVTKREKKATVQGTHFVITGLLFACKYRVAVMPLSGAPRSEAVTSVTTPQCLSLKGRGKKFIPCARDDHHPVVRKTQLRPEKLGVEFQAVNGSLRGVFSWQVSQAAPGQAPITGFQISWARVSSSHGSSSSSNGDAVASTTDEAISQTQTQTQTLPPDQFSFTVDALQSNSVYKVQVQVLSAGGSGPSVARTLHTPQLPASTSTSTSTQL